MSLIFFLILLLGLYMQIKLLLRKHPQHISPMHTVQTNNQIACPQTGKSWLTIEMNAPLKEVLLTIADTDCKIKEREI